MYIAYSGLTQLRIIGIFGSYRALFALDDAAAHIAEVMPIDRDAARAKLRGVAYGINDEFEREGDEAPYDWRVHRYSPRR
jgi:hypothetical protein